MAINTTISRVQYNGNSLTVSFPVTFKFIQNSDIVAELDDGTTVTTWVLDTDYTLSGAGVDTGGTLTATTAPATGETLTIYRQVTLTQESDLVTTGAFNSQTVEDMVDKNTQMIQQLSEGLGTSGLLLKYPNSEPSTTSNELPRNSDRANKFFTFDASGNPTAQSLSLSGSGAGDVLGPTSNTSGNIPQWGASLTLTDGLSFKDEDDMSSDSATALASQQSIKAYVDNLFSTNNERNATANIREVTTSTATFAVGETIIANCSTSVCKITLPSSISLGKSVRVVGKGSHGWRILQNVNQQIRQGNVTTSIGVSAGIESLYQHDSAMLMCTEANNYFTVLASTRAISEV